MFRLQTGPGFLRATGAADGNRFEVKHRDLMPLGFTEALSQARRDDVHLYTLRSYQGINSGPKRGGTQQKGILQPARCVSAGFIWAVDRSYRGLLFCLKKGGMERAARDRISSIPFQLALARNPGRRIMFSPLFRVHVYVVYGKTSLHPGGPGQTVITRW